MSCVRGDHLAVSQSHYDRTCHKAPLARGGSQAHLPDPIRHINPLSLEDEADCQQFLDDLEDATTLQRTTGAGSDVAERIKRLINQAKHDPTKG